MNLVIFRLYAATAKSLQSCPTLCDPIDGSPPGSAVPGILQARTLEWVAISFSNAWKWKVKVKSLSRIRPSVTPWTAAYQAPPSMGFSRQEYLQTPHPSSHPTIIYKQKIDINFYKLLPKDLIVPSISLKLQLGLNKSMLISKLCLWSSVLLYDTQKM